MMNYYEFSITNFLITIYHIYVHDSDLNTYFWVSQFLLNFIVVNDMIDSPFETKSDSFYFVNGNLIMHNKASYKVTN